ncbi:MAG: hypothetical protein ACYS7M_15795, partial [Planctomycetota bacterium]
MIAKKEWRARFARCTWCCVVLACVGFPGLALGDLIDGLEIDGSIIEGLDNTGCPGAPPADTLAPLDWASLFTVEQVCFNQGDPCSSSLTACTSDGDCGGQEFCLANFSRDMLAISSLTDCTVFGSTSDKNGNPIATWNFKDGNVPPKDELSNVYAYLAEDADVGRALYLGLERPTNDGDSHVDFEINQGEIGFNPEPGPHCPSGDCPSGLFTGQRCNKDTLVVVDFLRGGDLGQLRVFQYEGGPGADGIFCTADDPIPTLNTTPKFDSEEASDAEVCDEVTGRICFRDLDDIDTDGNTDELLICGVNSGAGDADGSSCEEQDENEIHSDSWTNYDRHADELECLPHNFFTEVAVNTDAFGLGVQRCLSSINAKTRSSHSITSELKDFAFIQFDTCSDISGQKFEVEDDGQCATNPIELEGWEIRLLDAAGNLVTENG